MCALAVRREWFAQGDRAAQCMCPTLAVPGVRAPVLTFVRLPAWPLLVGWLVWRVCATGACVARVALVARAVSACWCCVGLAGGLRCLALAR